MGGERARINVQPSALRTYSAMKFPMHPNLSNVPARAAVAIVVCEVFFVIGQANIQ
jgi:hypothetical protein